MSKSPTPSRAEVRRTRQEIGERIDALEARILRLQESTKQRDELLAELEQAVDKLEQSGELKKLVGKLRDVEQTARAS